MGSWYINLSDYMGGWCLWKFNFMGGGVKIKCLLPPPGIFFWNSLNPLMISIRQENRSLRSEVSISLWSKTLKGATRKDKNLLPQGSKFFPLRVAPMRL